MNSELSEALNVLEKEKNISKLAFSLLTKFFKSVIMSLLHINFQLI